MSEKENNNETKKELNLQEEENKQVADAPPAPTPVEMAGDDLWAAEDAAVISEDSPAEEEQIIPEKSQSLNIKNPFSGKGRNLKQMHRSDNFRRIIRKKSSIDKGDKTTPMRNSLEDTAKMVGDNERNEALECIPGHVPSLRDSMDSIGGNSISIERYLEGEVSLHHQGSLDEMDGMSISWPIPHPKPTDDSTPVNNTDNISEASSTHTDVGINDSITNMDYLKTYLYNMTLSVATTLWGFVTSGVGYVYTTFVLGGDGGAAQIEGGSRQEQSGEVADGGTDEADIAREPVISEKDKKRIHNIVNELLSTEKEYVKRLGILVKIKAGTTAILQSDVARSMFQNIEVIHQFHHDNLLPQLEKRISSWEDNPKIGDIMRKLAPFLKLYTEYVKNFTTANELFETSKQKSGTFASFVVEAENNLDYGRLKVQAHMLEPVQRVPRYELLLKDYLKKIPESSEDRADSQEALKLVSNAAKHFEAMMKRDSRIIELMRLQTQFEGAVNIVASDREFVRTGKVKLINIKAGKISDRVLHLFNDMLLISAEQRYLVPGMSDKLRIRHTFYLNDTKVVYGNNLEIPFTFYVKSPEQTVELAASSAEERRLWLDKSLKHIAACHESDVSDGDPAPNYNETTIDDGFMLQRYTFQLSSDGKNWKKRCLSLYDNGLIAVSRNTTDTKPMSSVHVCNFQAVVGSAQQKKGKVITLSSEYKTYQLYDDNHDFVDGWYQAIMTLSSKYGNSAEDDSSLDEWAVIQDHKSVRLSTISGDSGVDTLSMSSLQSNVST